jgi:hypothetical protein
MFKKIMSAIVVMIIRVIFVGVMASTFGTVEQSYFVAIAASIIYLSSIIYISNSKNN